MKRFDGPLYAGEQMIWLTLAFSNTPRGCSELASVGCLKGQTSRRADLHFTKAPNWEPLLYVCSTRTAIISSVMDLFQASSVYPLNYKWVSGMNRASLLTATNSTLQYLKFLLLF